MLSCPFCSQEISQNKPVEAKTWLIGCDHCLNPVVIDVSETPAKTRAPKGVHDIQTVAPEGSLGRALLDRFSSALESLPTFPSVAEKALHLANDPDSSVQDLAELVKQDQVLTLRILRYSNSALYGGLSEIKSVDAACARLGMKKIVDIIQTIVTGALYDMPDPAFRVRARKLRDHTVATAHCASVIGSMLAEPQTGMVFAAGLIHDIGKLVILKVVSEDANEQLEPLRKSDELLTEMLDGYHALFGLHTVQKWALPVEFAVTTYCHEDPATAPGEAWWTRVHVVALASEIADMAGFGLHAASEHSLVGHPSARFLGLNDVKLASIRVDLEDKVASLLEASNAE